MQNSSSDTESPGLTHPAGVFPTDPSAAAPTEQSGMAILANVFQSQMEQHTAQMQVLAGALQSTSEQYTAQTKLHTGREVTQGEQHTSQLQALAGALQSTSEEHTKQEAEQCKRETELKRLENEKDLAQAKLDHERELRDKAQWAEQLTHINQTLESIATPVVNLIASQNHSIPTAQSCDGLGK